MSLACFMELASHEEIFPETPTPSTRTGPRRAALRTDRARYKIFIKKNCAVSAWEHSLAPCYLHIF